MPRVCPFTGKKTTSGRQYTRRGKAKYLGGVGRKVTGKTLRKFRANIQRVRAVIDGRVVRMNVSTTAIRNGLIVKPLRRTDEVKSGTLKAARPKIVSNRPRKSKAKKAAQAAK